MFHGFLESALFNRGKITRISIGGRTCVSVGGLGTCMGNSSGMSIIIILGNMILIFVTNPIGSIFNCKSK